MDVSEQDQNPKNRRVHQRVELKRPLNVRLASIGGNIRYDLQTSDISYYGFFLAFDEPGRFPFKSTSILEIWLELPDKEVVFFNGKMARVVFPTDPDVKNSGAGIGIRIVQIDAQNEKKLDQFIQSVAPGLERKSKNVA